MLSFQKMGRYTLQAYAAAMKVFGQLRPLSKCVVLAIGGESADYMLLKKGRPDLSDGNSLECGVVLLHNRVVNAVNSAYDLLLDEYGGDSVLTGCNDTLPDDVLGSISDMIDVFRR